jgi:deferrochelatase/peroxidase EfeB
MLDTLQPNILAPHARSHLRVLLMSFATADAGKAFLRSVAQASPPIHKSAFAHLVERENVRDGRGLRTPYVGVGLSRSGYARLEADARAPRDPAFARGMRNKQTLDLLRDPPPSRWDEPYRGDVHAIVLIGAKGARDVDRLDGRIRALCPAGVSIAGAERGRAIVSREGWTMEHFGFRDAISDPLFLDEDIARAATRHSGPVRWDPGLPLGRVLVPDSTGDPRHFGSYLVYRKLEQDVGGFYEACKQLAGSLDLSHEQLELAGALLIGRFRDGTPVGHGAPGLPADQQNNFTYVDDLGGGWCPLTAHVRKTNPRGSSAEFRTERNHLMARRGQTYDERLATDGASDKRPRTGVGLLFMALNASIEEQFEHVQAQWASDHSLPIANNRRTRGADQIIGAEPRTELQLPARAGGPGRVDVSPVSQLVTMKGGEYFFLPSWPALEALSL